MLTSQLAIKKFRLYVHPFVDAYIKQGVVSLQRKWQFKYGWGVKVLPDQRLSYLEYRFVDSITGDEIDMTSERELR